MLNKARRKTDKQLKSMEKAMSRVYKSDPALLSVMRRYERYMDEVDKATRSAYMAYMSEIDGEKKAVLKKEYADAVEKLTVRSKEYKTIVRDFVKALSKANQKSLNIANAQMRKIYVENYNEVATECRKAGIKVDG